MMAQFLNPRRLVLKQVSILPWKQILRRNFTNINLLADFLQLSNTQRLCLATKPGFILNLPLRLAEKITKGSLEDPLFRQFVPTVDEAIISSGFISDPVGDSSCRKASKLLHKYQGRVLLVCTSACAMHCRYCFRQNFDYAITEKLFEEELRLINDDPSINEVILSGGDPLSLDDRILENLLTRLSTIPHIKKVRFHTRFPVGIPERIDTEFLTLLSSLPFQFWFVVHVNHPKELDHDVLTSLKAVQKLGIPVLNQFVLLRGINDDPDVLIELCDILVNNGIYPYYMHQLDRVQGAAHFEVSEERGMELIQIISKRLPGYAVPRYVKEISGMPGKTPIQLR
ncbi:MAG: KamA family radical SAM protein [Parachlamydiaceae bacterium]